MFEIGQQVVAMSEKFETGKQLAAFLGIAIPQNNLIYTIRGFPKCKCGQVGILLEEINNPERKGICTICGSPWTTETCFYPPHFRPLKKTSIEIFQKLLAPSPKNRVLEEV